MNEVDKAMDSVEQHDLYGQREVPIDHARVLAAEVRRLRAMLKDSDQQYSCFECAKLTRCPSPRNGMPTDGATPVCFEYKSADLEPTPDVRELADLYQFIDDIVAHRTGYAGLDELKRQAKYKILRIAARDATVREPLIEALVGARETISRLTMGTHPAIKAIDAALEAAKGEG